MKDIFCQRQSNTKLMETIMGLQVSESLVCNFRETQTIDAFPFTIIVNKEERNGSVL